MNTKYMSEQQCIRIIENNYLGEHDRKGKQVDYVDYKHDIDKQLWSLQEKRLGKLIVEQSSPEYEFLRDSIAEYTELVTSVLFNKTFNKWRYIAGRI